MKFTVDKNDHFTLLSVEEENLNAVVAPLLKSELVILRNEGIQNLILNLENVHYVDSSGLSSILTANRLWSENGTFVLTGVFHDNVKKLIEISRLESALNIVPTVQESKDYIMLSNLQREIESGDDS